MPFSVIRRVTRHGCVLLLLIAGACGPARLLPAPPELPESANGRRLWHTPHAYIYARETEIAGETDRWIDGLNGHLHRTYDGALGKGLVIVADVDDEQPIVATLDELDRLQRLLPASAAPASRPSPDERRRELVASGMSEEMACWSAVAPLDVAACTTAGLPVQLPRDVQWRMCCPSNRLALKITREFAPRAVERKKGKAFAIIAAPAMPVATLEAAKVFELTRDVTAFVLWSERVSGWDAVRREREAQRYMRERAFTLSPLLSLALTLAEKQKSDGSRASGDETRGAAPAD
ncbi:MAG: hypothetical protein HUU22_17405 [Phycisphaerae bacterium]|nr:hypothetical protein [Phycisphaerae bacterium]NUQ47800.1 hypothetical protein [Phycisphaerae bacterium]